MTILGDATSKLAGPNLPNHVGKTSQHTYLLSIMSVTKLKLPIISLSLSLCDPDGNCSNEDFKTIQEMVRK